MKRMSDEKLAENLASVFALKDSVNKRSWTYEMLFDGFKNGFLAGLKAEREKSKKLVETFRSHLNTMSEINAHIGYQFTQPLINAREKLKEYKKEG